MEVEGRVEEVRTNERRRTRAAEAGEKRLGDRVGELEDRIRDLMPNIDRVAMLEELVVKLQNEARNMDLGGDRGTVIRLQAVLSSKDSEISFLKETVRIECEERMGLVASVAKLQLVPEPQAQIIASPRVSATDPLSKALANSMTSKTKDPPLSSKDAEFLKLFKNASMKNAKRLKQQASKSALGNY